jgi:diaminohydroxyphosphoribosylaminopyrimidine deaminase/5-amino-6-(5-phosphoribosylamino)uracil reductase
VIVLSTEVICDDKSARVTELTNAGARVLGLPEPDLAAGLRALNQYGVSSIVIEGGAALHRAALDANAVDAIDLYIAPPLLGPDAVGWIGGGRLSWEALRNRRASWLGDVMLVEGYVHGTG